MKRRGRLVLAVVLVLGVSALTAFLAAQAGMGTDDRAAEAVEAMTGGTYEPWLHAPGVPGGDQNAPLLFGVQAGVGLALLAGSLWYWREHRSEA